MKPTTAVEVLRAARARIEKPEHWTREDSAKTVEGHGINSRATTAVCWCAYGAIEASALEADQLMWAACRLLEGVVLEVHGYDVVDFNDNPKTTHADVLAAFDKAIAFAEGE